MEAIYLTLLNCIHAEEFTIHMDLKDHDNETSGSLGVHKSNHILGTGIIQVG